MQRQLSVSGDSIPPNLEVTIPNNAEPRPYSLGLDYAPTVVSAVQTPPYDYTRGFAILAAAFNWGVIVLTLGSYGLLLPTPVFWVCWSILVTEAVIYYSIMPYWMWVENPKQITETQFSSNKVHRISDNGRVGAVFLKIGMSFALLIMLLYFRGFNKRYNKILISVGISIILFEGFPTVVLRKNDLKTLIRNGSGKSRLMQSITQGQDWNAANYLTPSVVNAMISVTGAIVLGGNLGSLMPEKPYWIFVSIFLVDLMAEALHRFDCGSRSLFDSIPQHTPKGYCAAIVLRLVVEGCLCYWMTEEISHKSYFPLHVDPAACDPQCQYRSKSLLITMVVLGGLQALGTVTAPICSVVLGPKYVSSIVLLTLVMVCYLAILVLCGSAWLLTAVARTIR